MKYQRFNEELLADVNSHSGAIFFIFSTSSGYYRVCDFFFVLQKTKN